MTVANPTEPLCSEANDRSKTRELRIPLVDPVDSDNVEVASGSSCRAAALSSVTTSILFPPTFAFSSSSGSRTGICPASVETSTACQAASDETAPVSEPKVGTFSMVTWPEGVEALISALEPLELKLLKALTTACSESKTICP